MASQDISAPFLGAIVPYLQSGSVFPQMGAMISTNVNGTAVVSTIASGSIQVQASDFATIGTVLAGKPVASRSVNFTATNAFSGYVVTCTAALTATLYAGNVGDTLCLVNTGGAVILTVGVPAGQTLKWGGADKVGATTLAATAAYSAITMTAVSSSVWVVTSIIGTWA